MTFNRGIYNAIIVDDDEIDRLSVAMRVKRYPFLHIAGIFDNAEAALAFMQGNEVHVLFLDVDMPGMNGLDMRRVSNPGQVCIFITAYPDYAVEGFELAALDFLLKPLNKERFDEAMIRLSDYLELRYKARLFECSLGGDALFIKDGHAQVKIQLHDIIYLEALKDYTRIVTTGKKYCVLSLLGNLLQERSFSSFVRIHRSYAVQKNFVNRVTAQQVHLKDIVLPVGRSYKSAVNELIGTF